MVCSELHTHIKSRSTSLFLWYITTIYTTTTLRSFRKASGDDSPLHPSNLSKFPWGVNCTYIKKFPSSKASIITLLIRKIDKYKVVNVIIYVLFWQIWQLCWRLNACKYIKALLKHPRNPLTLCLLWVAALCKTDVRIIWFLHYSFSLDLLANRIQTESNFLMDCGKCLLEMCLFH